MKGLFGLVGLLLALALLASTGADTAWFWAVLGVGAVVVLYLLLALHANLSVG